MTALALAAAARLDVIIFLSDVIVALIDTDATVKEFHRSRGDAIVLKPRSTNPEHKPIILTDDFQIQGVVVTSLPEDILN